jgi:hypothetical protein
LDEAVGERREVTRQREKQQRKRLGRMEQEGRADLKRNKKY